ncbi:hypothetical protein F2Q68_00013917 [Brassica cretica]|uniref:Uncharacterized protein n=1 Tax=Brassica cretica TaxID=69181 RepID=A0A8S9HV53_BRACR|nr:hypothetical protein F2Q68_00013917 [Brassica cretica]
MTGVRQAAGGEARFSKLKRLMVPVGDLSQQRAIVEVYSVARFVSLHNSVFGAFGSGELLAFGTFGSGELLLFADRQWIFGCPVVKPLWRRESLTFVVALAFSSSLPTWYVAGFCRFPTVCFHTVKLMSPVRLAVVDSPGVGSVCMFQLNVAQSFSLQVCSAK